jgi:ubiquinone/menaquinone biosynthesis C-methylase UbiE
MTVDPDIHAHYAAGREHGRLTNPSGLLELERTLDILARVLPPGADVLDIGGGTGRYAVRLTHAGHRVRLLDAMPEHVATALAHAAEDGVALVEATAGDARALPWMDSTADAALLLGPLYHLTEREDRRRALREAHRVVRAGGTVVAAAISRFASALDGIASRHLEEPAFAAIVARDLADGQHRNPTDHPAWFTTAYFHRPEDLAAELADAGFVDVQLYAVEGPAWLVRDLSDGESVLWERMLTVLRSIEREPTLIGASAHVLGVARRGSMRAFRAAGTR